MASPQARTGRGRGQKKKRRPGQPAALHPRWGKSKGPPATALARPWRSPKLEVPRWGPGDAALGTSPCDGARPRAGASWGLDRARGDGARRLGLRALPRHTPGPLLGHKGVQGPAPEKPALRSPPLSRPDLRRVSHPAISRAASRAAGRGDPRGPISAFVWPTGEARNAERWRIRERRGGQGTPREVPMRAHPLRYVARPHVGRGRRQLQRAKDLVQGGSDQDLGAVGQRPPLGQGYARPRHACHKRAYHKQDAAAVRGPVPETRHPLRARRRRGNLRGKVADPTQSYLHARKSREGPPQLGQDKGTQARQDGVGVCHRGGQRLRRVARPGRGRSQRVHSFAVHGVKGGVAGQGTVRRCPRCAPDRAARGSGLCAARPSPLHPRQGCRFP